MLKTRIWNKEHLRCSSLPSYTLQRKSKSFQSQVALSKHCVQTHCLVLSLKLVKQLTLLLLYYKAAFSH